MAGAGLLAGCVDVSTGVPELGVCAGSLVGGVDAGTGAVTHPEMNNAAATTPSLVDPKLSVLSNMCLHPR